MAHSLNMFMLKEVADKVTLYPQYAEDTSLFIDATVSSLNKLLSKLKFVSNNSGLKMNLQKSFLVGLGSSKG